MAKLKECLKCPYNKNCIVDDLKDQNRKMIYEITVLELKLNKSEQGWQNHFKLEKQYDEVCRENTKLKSEIERLRKGIEGLMFHEVQQPAGRYSAAIHRRNMLAYEMNSKIKKLLSTKTGEGEKK